MTVFDKFIGFTAGTDAAVCNIFVQPDQLFLFRFGCRFPSPFLFVAPEVFLSIVIVFQCANLQLFTGFLPIFFAPLHIRKLYWNMALIKSISGIRGTIGGKPGEALTPLIL